MGATTPAQEISCAAILQLGLAALGPGPARAGDTANENPTVVVTANRVAENAQDVS